MKKEKGIRPLATQKKGYSTSKKKRRREGGKRDRNVWNDGYTGLKKR